MPRLAREKVPAAKFRPRSLTEARLPRCDAVVATARCDVRARRVGGRAPADVARFFSRVHEALEPGGLSSSTSSNPARGARMPPNATVGADWVIAGMPNSTPQAGPHAAAVTIGVGRQYQRAQETHRVQIYGRRAGEGARRPPASPRACRGPRTIPADGRRRRGDCRKAGRKAALRRPRSRRQESVQK